jgi:hypothetical protein
MTFADQLKPLVDALGVGRSAEICGVTPRTIHLWVRGRPVPSLATQAGALMLLRAALAGQP